MLWVVVILLSIGACGRSERKYLGEWVNVQSPDSFAKIYEDGDALIWEDDEGKYPARIEDGQLKVSSGLGDIVVQYVESTDHLIAAGQEFKRKDS
jgi:hypothetical protein